MGGQESTLTLNEGKETYFGNEQAKHSILMEIWGTWPPYVSAALALVEALEKDAKDQFRIKVVRDDGQTSRLVATLHKGNAALSGDGEVVYNSKEHGKKPPADVAQMIIATAEEDWSRASNALISKTKLVFRVYLKIQIEGVPLNRKMGLSWL